MYVRTAGMGNDLLQLPGTGVCTNVRMVSDEECIAGGSDSSRSAQSPSGIMIELKIWRFWLGVGMQNGMLVKINCMQPPGGFSSAGFANDGGNEESHEVRVCDVALSIVAEYCFQEAAQECCNAV